MTNTGLTLLAIVCTLAAISAALVVHRKHTERERARARAVALGDAVSNLVWVVDGPGSTVHGKWVNDGGLSLRETKEYQRLRKLSRLKVRRP